MRFGAAALAVTGGLARICTSLELDWSGPLVMASGIVGASAFGGFALLYGPLLCRPRLDTVAT